ncbi:MAG: NAD-dependent epimerase/dehydratase family protein [Candidatus Baldrarchaeia archaeon]
MELRVLVTGGTGFIGRHLVRKLLERGHEVAVFARNPADIPGVTFFTGDIRDGARVNEVIEIYKPEIVYHLAALVSYSASKKLLFEVNVGGTKNVAEACLKNDAKLVFMSSVAAIGEHKGITNEETPCKPFSAYGKSKLAAEKVVLEACERGLWATIIRGAPAYGEGGPQWRVIIPMIASGKLPMIGPGTTPTHLVYVENLTDALLTIPFHEDANSQVFIVADEEPITLLHLYKLILDTLGIERKIKRIPVWLAKLVVWLSQVSAKIRGQEPKITLDFLKVMLAYRHYDISKAKSFGYEPKYSTDEGFVKVIEWCKREGLIHL